jgi:molybdenum cofactor synthesis domain-containing protein
MTRAAILAIGTELTQGQITNRNAAWISDRLTRLGLDVAFHVAVPDEREAVLSALESCAKAADLVVVTGGLGPTTDDLTRDLVAEWAGAELEFREASWEKIVARLRERGIEVAPSNRRQCWFPAGATVLENLEGTADGFRISRLGSEVVVLPGPPREVEHLWNRFVRSWIVGRFPDLRPERLETWKCLGKSESALGEIVEEAARGFGVKTGYRSSAPYVEVKIWIPSDYPPERGAALLAALDGALAPYAVVRNDEDLGTKLLEALSTIEGDAIFLDLGTDGVMADRLQSALQSPVGRAIRSRCEVLTRFGRSESVDSLPERASEWILALDPAGRVAVTGPRGKLSHELPNPYPAASEANALLDRLRRYRTELALREWTRMIHELGDGEARA